MAAQADMARLFAQPHQNHKIQNNHQSEPSEIKLRGSLTTMELKKPHPSRLVGGEQTRSELVPHPHEMGKNSGGISQEQAGPAPHQAPPSPGFQCPEGKTPQLLAKKSRRD